MKVSCEIIKDLLPLYCDGVCSPDSRAMVEKHLTECDSCKTELEQMHTTSSVIHVEQNLKEAEAIQKLSKKWKKGMLKSVLKGVLSTVLTIALLALILYVFMDFKVVPKL